MQRFNQDSADCLVFTYKEGLLSAVAHDLKIKVTRFEIEVDETARKVEARFDASSLRVVCAMREGAEVKGALSTDQKREIEGNIVRDVLAPEDFPSIEFVSTAAQDTTDGFRIRGQLSLHGKLKSVAVTVRREGDRYVARATVRQPNFGIQPYSALLGTLRVKADVEIEIVILRPVSAADPAA